MANGHTEKQIYIEARNLLEIGEEEYLCHALYRAMSNLTGIACKPVSQCIIHEMFNEFVAMDEGVWWYRDYSSWARPRAERASDYAWWENDWVEPRLAMIDYLLSR